jgi:bifunctional non-homologous end joining protein LigD
MDEDDEDGGAGITLSVSSAEKVLFPDAKITKGALIDYYAEVASAMLPHLRDRPLTLHRFPAGIERPGFFQKRIDEDAPPWVERVAMPTRGGEAMTYALANNGATLLYLANKNSIAFHTCAVRRGALERPDLLVFDLDPSDDDFEKIRLGAKHLGAMLAAVGLEPYVKTSGSRGLHVVAPIVPEEDDDGVRGFARAIAERLCRRDPSRFTLETVKKRRGDRVFLDLRNASAQTVVAPYSARALPGAPVAAPITWKELEEPELHGRRFSIREIPARLRAIGDPWRELAAGAKSLRSARARLATLD